MCAHWGQHTGKTEGVICHLPLVEGQLWQQAPAQTQFLPLSWEMPIPEGTLISSNLPFHPLLTPSSMAASWIFPSSATAPPQNRFGHNLLLLQPAGVVIPTLTLLDLSRPYSLGPLQWSFPSLEPTLQHCTHPLA